MDSEYLAQTILDFGTEEGARTALEALRTSDASFVGGKILPPTPQRSSRPTWRVQAFFTDVGRHIAVPGFTRVLVPDSIRESLGLPPREADLPEVRDALPAKKDDKR